MVGVDVDKSRSILKSAVELGCEDVGLDLDVALLIGLDDIVLSEWVL